eukprot:8095073-Karenia_brevis.AAC.1
MKNATWNKQRRRGQIQMCGLSHTPIIVVSQGGGGRRKRCALRVPRQHDALPRCGLSHTLIIV